MIYAYTNILLLSVVVAIPIYLFKNRTKTYNYKYILNSSGDFSIVDNVVKDKLIICNKSLCNKLKTELTISSNIIFKEPYTREIIVKSRDCICVNVEMDNLKNNINNHFKNEFKFPRPFNGTRYTNYTNHSKMHDIYVTISSSHSRSIFKTIKRIFL